MGRILITGAAGGVGSFLVAGLPALGWQIRGFDLRPGGDAGVEWVAGDVRDPDALDAAMSDVEAVVHLAGIPNERPFPELLAANIEGSYQVFEAARRAGVTRIVYASSNHAVGFTPRAELVGVDVRPRPDTFYGLTKVFGEGLASLYVDRYGMGIACVRIGSCFARPTTVRQLSTWLSPGDAVRLVHACLTAPDLGYAVVYGISANTRGWWDLAPARALGYEPRDDAERYAEEILAERGPLDDDDPDAKYLGGRFVKHEPSRSH
jgi:uronate dehydrogenase